MKDASGQLVNSNIQPEMKTALEALQKLYAAKAIDKEFGTKDAGKIAEAVTSGKLGMYYGAMWTPIWPIRTAEISIRRWTGNRSCCRPQTVSR